MEVCFTHRPTTSAPLRDAECGKRLQTQADIQTVEEAQNRYFRPAALIHLTPRATGSGRCSDEEGCSFIIARPHKVILCASDTYNKPKRQPGSTVSL